MRCAHVAAACAVASAALSALVACDGALSAGGGPAAEAQAEEEEQTVSDVPAGASCAGQRDCAAAQICVAGSCRYAATSRTGEILAAAASAQLEAGDVAGAVGTYAQAMEAFGEAEAPVPPEVACGAASAALRVAADPASRETAASYADRCFRSSVPGDPHRAEVQRALARLRFDGLDVSLFDRESPAERYFTKQQSRPTTDAIEIALSIADRDHSGYATVSESLRSEQARHAIAECFLADWELHHRRSSEASLLLKFETRMRDMGDYDVFQGTVEVSATSDAQGFEPCVAEKLTEALGPGPRTPYPVRAWQEPFEVAARLQ